MFNATLGIMLFSPAGKIWQEKAFVKTQNSNYFWLLCFPRWVDSTGNVYVCLHCCAWKGLLGVTEHGVLSSCSNGGCICSLRAKGGLPCAYRSGKTIQYLFSTVYPRGVRSSSHNVHIPWVFITHRERTHFPLSTVRFQRVVPMDRVITLSCLRTSLTTMLFCSGVERQHSTERQSRASSRNRSSRPPCRIMSSVLPSITSPNSGPGLSEAGKDVGIKPKSFLRGFSTS